MTPLLLFAGLSVGGLRSPWTWTLFAVLSWGAALAARPRARLPGAPLWAAVLGWTAVSTAFSPEPLVSLTAFSYSATAFLWLCLGATSAGAEERRLGTRLLFLAGVGAAAAAVFLYIPSYPAVGLFFPYYNYTAAIVAAAGAASVAARVPGLGALCPAAALYLVLVGSRGGLAALAAGTALALWRGGRRRFVLTGLAVGLGFFLVPSAPRDAFLKVSRSGSHARPAIWRSALLVAAENPWLGEGPGRFSRGFLRHQVPAPPALRRTRYALTSERAHSGPLDAAAEIGFVGAGLLLAALLALWSARPAAPADPDREALLAAAAALGTQALGDSIFALPGLAWLFAWALGAACAAEHPGRPRLPEALRRVLLGAGLALAAAAWWPGWAVTAWRETNPAAALAVAPSDAGAWQNLARRHLHAGDHRAALSALARAARLRPYDARPRVMAAEILRAGQEWQAVLEAASEAVALEPACGQGRLLRAEALARLGRAAEAAAELAALKASGALPLNELSADDPEALVLGYDPERLASLLR